VAMSGGVGVVEVMKIAFRDIEENARLFLAENNLGDHRVCKMMSVVCLLVNQTKSPTFRLVICLVYKTF
jgi:hypothetical protein